MKKERKEKGKGVRIFRGGLRFSKPDFKKTGRQLLELRKSHRLIFGTVIGLSICLAASILLPYIPVPYTLHLGLFSTSNWNVPESGTYAVVDQVIREFEKSHPYVRVEYTSGIVRDDYSEWLSDQIVQGIQPDVFMVLDQDFNMLASLGALLDLDSYIRNDEMVSPESFYQPAVEEGTYNHQVFALPYQCNLKLMFVNKKILEEQNIEIPDWDWTTSEFSEICRQVSHDFDQDGTYDQWGVSGYSWNDAAQAFGLNLFDENGESASVNQDGVRQAVQFMQETGKYDQSRQQSGLSDGFDSGLTAFAPMSLAEYKTYGPYPWKVRRYSTFDWTSLPMPSSPDSDASCSLDTLMMGISSTTRHRQASRELLRIFTADPGIQEMMMDQTSGMSAMRQLIAQKDDQEDDLSWKMLDYALSHTRSKKRFRKYEDAMSLLNNGISEILRSSSDLDLELLELQKQLNTFLRE